ncbi:MAG: cytochrome c3 family protein [Terriglobales bacterium]
MTRRFRVGVLYLCTVAVCALAQTPPPAALSPLHNLSPDTSGGGTLACIYCHTSHNAAPVQGLMGLWNHQLSDATYDYHSSSTYTQGTQLITPTAGSRLCMSCHDGTVALGATYNYSSVTAETRVPLSTGGNMGSNLARSHPFAFDQWTPNNSLVNSLLVTNSRTTANSSVKLKNGRIECTTCHEPHIQNIDPWRPSDFLVIDNRNGTLCLACHDAGKPAPADLAGWLASAHAVSASTEVSPSGYASVHEGACANCHVQHQGATERLLRGAEEQTCYSCHANQNSQNPWGRAWIGYDQKNYRHPVEASGHDPKEDLLSANTPRHSKCWDCHNSHAALDNSQSAPAALGNSLVGAPGIMSDGTPTSTATAQYQVCFKCHGDSNNKPQKAGFTDYGYTPVRLLNPYNVRKDLNSDVARHNVVRPFSGATYPDLRDNILLLNNTTGRALKTPGSFLPCTDCHNGENPSSDGGSGPNGPHISSNIHILERPYTMNVVPDPGQPVQSLVVTFDPRAGTFALCDKCHDLSGLLGDGSTVAPKDSVFKHHGSHVLKMGISCAVCHAPHGVDNGATQFNANLINLDTQLTGQDPGTGRWYIDTISRTCYVTCHFSNDHGTPVVHSGVSYDSGIAAGTAKTRLRPK